MMKIYLLILTIVLPVSLAGGQDKPPSTHFNGLIIDQRNAGDVLADLGPPASDGLDTIDILKRNWVDRKLQDKSWRVMCYTNIPEYREVRFLFDWDGVLEIIQYEPIIGISAHSFHNAYFDFPTKPYFGGMSESFDPKPFGRSLSLVFPPSYPAQYEIAGVDYQVIIIAGVNNPHPGAIIKPAKRIDGGNSRNNPGERYEESYPGTIHLVQIISRTLQNKDDAKLRNYLPAVKY